LLLKVKLLALLRLALAKAKSQISGKTKFNFSKALVFTLG
jgi:hypothetical protein